MDVLTVKKVWRCISMRILFITNNYYPYSGGVVSSINFFTDALQSHGHDVKIATFQFLEMHPNDPQYVYRVPYLISFWYMNNPMVIPRRMHKHILLVINQFQPDVIHVHHPFLLGVVAQRIACQKNIPVIFTYHTMYDCYSHYFFPFSWVAKYISKRYIKRFCNKVTTIVAPSRFVKNMLTASGLKSVIEVIPTGVQKCFFEIREPIVNEAVRSPVRLLYVGRMVKEKNIPLLFDVCAQLTVPYTLTLVGYGVLYETLQKMAYEQYKLSCTDIIFIHRPEKEELVQHYRNSDIFLFPSVTDTQGVVIVEGMSQSRPVIAINGPGQQDMVEDGNNGYIVFNASQMAQKIELIAKNKLLYQSLQRGSFTTSKKYSAKELVKSLLAVYHSCL